MVKPESNLDRSWIGHSRPEPDVYRATIVAGGPADRRDLADGDARYFRSGRHIASAVVKDAGSAGSRSPR
jgi:hypothetical protein